MQKILTRSLSSIARCICKESSSSNQVNLKLSEIQKSCPFVKSLTHLTQETFAEMSSLCPVMSKIDTPVRIENDCHASSDHPRCPHRSPLASEHHLRDSTYNQTFDENINILHSEGRYRHFANLKRHCGNFPNATYRSTDDET